ncbi:hypothetical protein FGO68_gene11937 [Halteria grandinella]|uniref:Uncharacterized protein n=1 Tax=Halteria grandinella TaxID=5974 RepID=A0A8J8SWB8_HALGN|nr:hypothetical protein FGO68_gene11937 [Halteria grandinella]
MERDIMKERSFSIVQSWFMKEQTNDDAHAKHGQRYCLGLGFYQLHCLHFLHYTKFNVPPFFYRQYTTWVSILDYKPPYST